MFEPCLTLNLKPKGSEPPSLGWLRLFKPLRMVKLARFLKKLPLVLRFTLYLFPFTV